MPSVLGATSAWISTSTGRAPSTPANTAAPGAARSRPARNSALGLATSASPAPVISNTPISSVAPNRFLVARRMRKACAPSPSNDITASTMCSTTRGPAICPSLVTWPTITTAAPLDLAKRISAWLAVRTWVTLPGADSTASLHSVWIESRMTSFGGSPEASVATMSSTSVCAASCTGASVSPSRPARSRICSVNSSPET